MKLLRLNAFLSMLMIWGSAAFAQTSNAIIFTENGEKFTVILNGLRQNEKPETNVKVEGLNANFYKMKVIFDDAALGQNNFNLNIEPGTETTFVIKKNSKNVYVLRPMSMVPMAQAPATSTESSVVTYNPNAAPYTGGETIVQETTTTTTTSGTPTGGGVSMGINVDETNGNFNMNVSGFDQNGAAVTTQQTTTVTTTTSTSSNTNSQYNAPPPPPPAYLPGYNGPIGCPVPMAPGDFESMKASIASKSFEDSKMTIAKQILNSNCLLSGQVREVMGLFTYEESKLDFAKYAYGKTYDIGNYYKVNDAFTFESSIDDLNGYINSYRR